MMRDTSMNISNLERSVISKRYHHSILIGRNAKAEFPYHLVIMGEGGIKVEAKMSCEEQVVIAGLLKRAVYTEGEELE